MAEKGFNKFLTILLIIFSIALVVLIGFFLYDLYEKYFLTKDASEFVDEFLQEVAVNTTSEENIVSEENGSSEQVEQPSQTNETTQNTKVATYKGFDMVGTIEIPVINLKYPILEKETKRSIEVAVAVRYGPGPNQIGNTTIVGHNYRNGLFFSKNKRLNIGDKIYITDNSGTRITYSIYNKYSTTPEDATYMTRNTNGAREISLATCSDDSSTRLIIWAKEE